MIESCEAPDEFVWHAVAWRIDGEQPRAGRGDVPMAEAARHEHKRACCRGQHNALCLESELT